MKHIHISGHKDLCAKYTFCFILIGEKRLGTSEDSSNPPPLPKKGNRGHNLRMWRKERWLRLSPQQVMCMLWKNNLLISRLTVRKG
ncbi:hypothetical protein AB205_0190460 [Aquarana catesbeiana]|uniref:Uncharacterized protein n=1 Tax=Aquarana catesbeiana TaxID=8400 RepID=A0A2G9SL47_AQUCT|nr:hypothetical protein AB205_0190460 [Aquarana catesbeiana]